MALDFNDFHELRTNETLKKKTRLGILAKVRAILDSNKATEGTERWEFARDAMRNPLSFEEQIVHFIIEENKGAVSTTVVIDASQALYDTNVALAVDKLFPVGT